MSTAAPPDALEQKDHFGIIGDEQAICSILQAGVCIK
jgi:hypothetical protein